MGLAALAGGATAGVTLATTLPASATVPTWPSGQYSGVLSNVAFTIPISISGGTLPLTSMTVSSVPANTSGFGLSNVNLATGTADMVGTYTAGPGGTPVTARITATNASGSATGSFYLEAYNCSWATSTGTTSVFDANQSTYLTGTQSAFGAAVTNGFSETSGTGTLSPSCSHLYVPTGGASVELLANGFAGVISPANHDNARSEADLWASCGSVSFDGTTNGHACGSPTVPAATGTHTSSPPGWQNGGTLTLSSGSETDGGDTSTSLAFCPPSQAAVNAGLGVCSDTVSTQSSNDAYQWAYSRDLFLYNGQPVPQTSTAVLSAAAALPGGFVSVTGGSNWWGDAAGAPVAGTGHTQSGSYHSVPAPGVYIGTSRATAVPAASSTVSISATTYSCSQASSVTPPNPCSFTPGAITGAFQVPAGLAPGAYNVYVDEPNTTPFMGNGPNDSYQTGRGTSLGTAESTTPLLLGTAAAITSAGSTTFTAGAAGSFTVTTTGSPTPSITESGALPAGVTFTDNGDGTATLAGTPGGGTGGSYAFTITATNGLGANATQRFSLGVNQAPAITSAGSTTFTQGSAGTFTVRTTGVPVAAVDESGALPAGTTFTDNGDGTATLAGTPAAGTAGTYTLAIAATNGVSPDATQSFTLTVHAGPAITSAAATTFSVGTNGSFVVSATGNPTPSLSESGALPTGVTFADEGNGTASLSGTPAAGTGGSYAVTITAANGVGSNATQSFTLTVDQSPAITSAATTTFVRGSASSFTVHTTGNPTPSINETGALPAGVSFTDNGDGTATLAGTPAAGTAGSYALTITASDGVAPVAAQYFTLTVDQAPAITSSASTTFTAGSAGSFVVIATGNPAPSLSETGSLPSGVSFTDNGNGTATLAGTPAAGTGGSYAVTITAANGVGTNATQHFTLTVDQAPAITSGAATTFTVGANGSFSVSATGVPTPSVNETGTLPSGVSFTDNGDGTATLSGTPVPGTTGTYAITITAANGVGTNATQYFTFTVDQAPAITSGSSTTFTVGSTGSFAVTSTGFPAPSLSESGALPSGVHFTDNGNGTATLAGTPAAGTAGTYAITITAANGVGANANQSFTLTVAIPLIAPSITSPGTATFTAGSAGTFTVDTTGSPNPAVNEAGALPTGVTFTDNGDGTATLAGTPAAGTGGSYAVTITASNGVGTDATQSFTLTVDQAPAITSAATAAFTEEAPGSITIQTTGTPSPSVGESGALPAGVTFTDNGNGTASLSGTPAAGSAGTYPITITAANGVGTDATQSFTLTVALAPSAPAVTSAATATFTAGSAGTFTVTATGNPTPAIDESGTLPAGVSFTDNGNGTATLSGTPAAGTGGSYVVTITAANGVGANATQSFTLTVDQAPAVTSAATTTFTAGSAGSFTVHATGVPAPALSKSGTLPSGVSFTDNGNGTATLSGTPAAGTGGTYPITITAANGVGSNATQSFTLTVDQAPAVTSAAAATFTAGSAGTFTVHATGVPTPVLSKSGTLPSGVSFTDNGNGTATLAGTPAAGTGGTYPITITAANGVGANATQSFTLTVDQAPAITSAGAATFTAGSAGTFTVTATGIPTPGLSKSGTLPSGVSFTDNGNGTATLSGTPAAGTGGSYPITITAANGVGANATQSFTLTVDQAPAVTSAATTTFAEGSSGTFTVTATGIPTPGLSKSGTLPSGVSFTDNGDGTATLSGTPAAGTGGSYPITITAANGVGANATQSFTLTVDQAPAITSAAATTFTAGSAGNFTVQATGVPAPALSRTGTLPSGVTFTDNGNGTASLSGTPGAGTGGTYPITITAANGVGSDATQSFTLTVDASPAISSAASTSFVQGSAGTFTISTTGNPRPTLSETGMLPSGVSFTDNGNGSATLAGTPAAGTAGSYAVTITGANGIGSNATQSFTLTVDAAPAITSANATSFTEATPGSFTVHATGVPAPSLSRTGALPSGVSFTDNGNGTATLSGTPAAGTAGTYPITVTAANGVGANATQSFTLTVVPLNVPPTITTAGTTSFTQAVPGWFVVRASGKPVPALNEAGQLPPGVFFSDNGDGTATLSGTAPLGTAGNYTISIIASNGIQPNAVQSFTLSISSLPAFTTPDTAVFVEGQAGSFLAQASGTPTPSLSESGALPEGISFVRGNGTGTFSGTAASHTAGTYTLTITASNGASSRATQTFTLIVEPAGYGFQIVTSSLPDATATAQYGAQLLAAGGSTPYRFKVVGGALPTGLHLSGHGVIHGKPLASGVYAFTVRAIDHRSKTHSVDVTSKTLSIIVTQPEPQVTGLKPGTGAAAGGNQVAVHGVALEGATSVSFGGKPARIVRVESSGSAVIVVAPAGSGTVDVTVVTPGGTSAPGPADRYVYGS